MSFHVRDLCQPSNDLNRLFSGLRSLQFESQGTL
jgi:hypothetical protein